MGGGHLREGEGLHALEGVLLGEGRQAASEEGVLPVGRVGTAVAVVVEEGVLPVGRVGAAAAVGCSCCRSCGVINPSPATRDKKTADEKQSPFLLSQSKEESSHLILKEEKTADEHKRLDE